MLEELTLPITVPLPPVEDGEVFTPMQWATLIAMCEVFVPPIASSQQQSDALAMIPSYIRATIDQDAVPAYLAESIVDGGLKESLRRRFAKYIPKGQVKEFATLLSTLNTRLGLLIMTGGLTPLQSLSLPDRTRVICGWSRSYLAPLRTVFASIEMLAKVSWLPASPTLHKLTGFPVVPEHAERNPSFEFQFADFSSSPSESVRLEYDIVIVGSGCGAGVMASHLARNTAEMNPRPRIAVLEKSYHFSSSHFPMRSDAAGEHLFESGGAVQSDDGTIAILAGSTWGGGGTVNWSASLQPQHFVREEWAASGLDFFTGHEFQDCLDTVCARMGVAKMNDEAAKSKIPHNYGNTALLEGARRLGMAAEVVPQNTAGEAHWCGYCNEGCASATKQGPANCWLPDAARHGVDFIEGCFVHEILWDDDNKTARGVRATWTSRDHATTRLLHISCSRVVLGAGTLQSPALLLRSGITAHHVGRNLHLHPVVAIGTVWRDRAKPWDGPILTAAVTAYENLDGAGHGPKIEMLAGTPAYMLTWTVWDSSLSSGSALGSALDYKLQCLKYAHTTAYISLQRDRDTGRVYLDSSGSVRVSYTPSRHDCTGVLAGIVACSRIAHVQGAMEIRPYAADMPPFIRQESISDGENDAAFALWVEKIKKIGVRPGVGCRFGSAHQMGTCRMSKSPDTGVVDPKGKVWNTKNVYVADASAFPSASGVNPMVTTMGIAEWVARGIVRELKQQNE